MRLSCLDVESGCAMPALAAVLSAPSRYLASKASRCVVRDAGRDEDLQRLGQMGLVDHLSVHLQGTGTTGIAEGGNYPARVGDLALVRTEARIDGYDRSGWIANLAVKPSWRARRTSSSRAIRN